MDTILNSEASSCVSHGQYFKKRGKKMKEARGERGGGGVRESGR